MTSKAMFMDKSSRNRARWRSFPEKSWMSHKLLLSRLYFVKTIVNSLRQEYLHYGWEGVAKKTWFYTINFSDCLNGLIRDMFNQLWVIIIIGKKKRENRNRKYFRCDISWAWRVFAQSGCEKSFWNHGRIPREKNIG